MSLTFEELQAVNRARCEESFHRLDEWSATNWACALGGGSPRRITGPGDGESP